jgi:hypothetical protein
MDGKIGSDRLARLSFVAQVLAIGAAWAMPAHQGPVRMGEPLHS